MGRQIVFQGNLDPAQENLTVRFTDAVAFIIDAPFLASEYEIDAFLNVYIPTESDELVRVVNLGKIEEQAILLNIAETDVASIIPLELIETGIEMALLFLSSDNTFLQVTVLQKDFSLREVTARLDEVTTRLEVLESAFAQDGIIDRVFDVLQVLTPVALALEPAIGSTLLLLEQVIPLLEGANPNQPVLTPAEAQAARLQLGFGFF